MRKLWRWIISPDVGDEDLNRRAQVANLTAVFIMLAVPLVMLVETLVGSSPFGDPLTFLYLAAGIVAPLISLILIRLHRPQAGIYWLLGAITLVMATSAIPYGLSAANFTILAAVVVLAALLAGGRGILLAVAASFAATLIAYVVSRGWPGVNLYSLQNEALMEFGVFALLGLLTWLFHRSLTQLVHRTRQQAQDVTSLNAALEQRVAQLAASSEQLQQTIVQSQHHAQRLATAAEVSHALSGTLAEPAELLDRVANLVAERFGVPFVGIFLLDEARRVAELRSASGEAGRQMVQQGVKLAVDDQSAIGWCMGHQQARVALDAGDSGTEALRFAVPFLPDAHSELALPLVSRGEVLGAMSVQTAAGAAFDEEDIAIFQTIADQVANTIVNAGLLAQTQTALAEMREAQQVYLAQAWSRFLPTRRTTGYQRRGETTQPLGHRLLPEARQAVTTARTLTAPAPDGATLVVPLTVRGQVIGALGMQDSQRLEWNPTEVAMAETIAEQVALAVEDARLFAEAQASLAEVTATYQRYVREAWEEYLPGQPATLFEYVAGDRPAEAENLPAVQQAASQGQPVQGGSAESSLLAVPLGLRGQIIGVLGFQDQPGRQWSEDERAVAEAVAEQMALAVESARLFDESQSRLAEVIATHRRYLRGAWEKFLPTRADATVQFARAGAASLPDVMTPELEQALTQRRGTIASTAEDRSLLAAPIVLRGEVVGALGLQDEGTARRWTSEEIELVESVAAELALAVENARLFEETQYRAIQLETAAEVSRAATAVLDFAALADEAVNLLRERFDLYYVGLFLLDDRRDYAVLQSGTGEAGRLMVAEDYRLKVGGRSMVGWCAVNAQARIAVDVDEDVVYLDNPRLPHTRSELVLPLISRGQVIGVLDVQSVRSRAFSDTDVAVFQTMAYQLANAIENARAYQELQDTAEQLKEMDRLKSQFLANMSHELRTPLNAIIGFSRVMLKGIDGPLTDPQQTDLAAIYDNGQQLLKLINDVLDISKIQAGKMELAFGPVDFGAIIQHIMTTTASALVKDKSIELYQEVQPDLPIIQGDETRLRQVVLNLLGNATKFTQAGSITVRAWADAEQVTVSITDTGIGIAPEHQALIFEEFRQVDGSLTRQTGGTGLGLAISRHLIEQHGGRIWVESATNEGSTFSFTVPIVHLRQFKLPELAQLKIDTTHPVILVVDAQDGVITLYRRYLEKHGYQVVGLNVGGKVLAWTRDIRPFAIIEDPALPDKDGWAVLEELKSDPELADTPVIISTMLADGREQAYQRGACAYLTKPVLEQDLLGVLKPLESV